MFTSKTFKTALFLGVVLCACTALADEAPEAAKAVEAAFKYPKEIFYAIAAAIGIGSLSAGYAVGKVGSAAMGGAAEKPELLGKAIAFVGLGEGIALFGFLISLLLVLKF